MQSDQNRERIRYLGLLVGYIDLLYIGCQCLLLPGRQGSGQNMGVMRRVFCLRRSADHRELRPL